MENDPPDCDVLLDEFVRIASVVAPGETLVLKVTSNDASLEIFRDNYSIFKATKAVNPHN